MLDADQVRDPFGDDIVTSPRVIEPAVESLNQQVLSDLVERFRDLACSSAPRLSPQQSALLVLSPEPGYGKSHLLGRLFRALADEATLLYLRPFQDPTSCWVSILDKVVAELDQSDDGTKLRRDPGEPTHLDTLVRRILAAAVKWLLEAGQVELPDHQKIANLFQKYPQMALETQGVREWVMQQQQPLLAGIERFLAQQGFELRTKGTAWFKVLLTYAYSEDNLLLRQLCLDWMTYRPLDPEEGQLLHLRRAELPDVDLPYEQRNEKCFERITDLFALGGFYRPYLLCFDQTELYGVQPGLARALGVAISRLRREAGNHLVVVTANAKVWQARVFKHFEVADQHAFAALPLELEGMSREQAEELLHNRLARGGRAVGAGVFSGQLLDKLYAQFERRSARDVLRNARGAWGPSVLPPAPSRVFEAYRRRLLASAKGLQFDAGVLQWAVQDVFAPVLGLQALPLQSPKGHLNLQMWLGGHQCELFGFEGGSHWRRWEAIFQEVEHCQRTVHEGVQVRATLFRFPAQGPLPKRVTAALAEHSHRVRVLELTRDQVADLFAAHDIVADVQQGNQELGHVEVMAFVRARLRGVAERLRDPVVLTPEFSDGGATQGVPLAEAIQGVVRRKRFVTLTLLRAHLPKDLDGHSDDELIHAAGMVADIKVHVTPATKVLQWRR